MFSIKLFQSVPRPLSHILRLKAVLRWVFLVSGHESLTMMANKVPLLYVAEGGFVMCMLTKRSDCGMESKSLTKMLSALSSASSP